MMANDMARPEVWALDKLKPYEQNMRLHPQTQIDVIKRSIQEFGFINPIIVKGDGEIVAGHGRLEAIKQLGFDKVPVLIVDYLTEDQARAYRIADNQIAMLGEWDEDMLRVEVAALSDSNYDLDLLGFDMGDLEDMIGALDTLGADGTPRENPNDDDWIEDGGSNGALAERFGVPPFSVIDSIRGHWRAGKKRWVALGIESHEGREGFEKATVASNKLSEYKGIEYKGGGSIFDPVLCEVLYKWFNVPNGTILDPFAGGSVRGLVASALGYPYIGHELRPEQVVANRKQFVDVGELRNWAPTPIWIEGDSAKTIPQYTEEVDMVFSCPPYAFLEVYSDDPADISNMSYDDFLVAYRAIIKASCDRLAENRFACFVIGEVRAKDGGYINFVGDTIKAFMDAGMEYYNEIVYVTPIGTLILRAGRAFSAGRKIGKTHQNVLVFYKGDPKKATQHWRDVEIKMDSAEEYYED